MKNMAKTHPLVWKIMTLLSNIATLSGSPFSAPATEREFGLIQKSICNERAEVIGRSIPYEEVIQVAFDVTTKR